MICWWWLEKEEVDRYKKLNLLPSIVDEFADVIVGVLDLFDDDAVVIDE
jgi:hypothetical protein